jgi:hypothetical protein
MSRPQPTSLRITAEQKRGLSLVTHLSSHELYALTVCILAQNKPIDANLIIDAQSLPGVRRPNRDDFLPRFPERTPSK